MNAHLNRRGLFFLKREQNHQIIAFLTRLPNFSCLKTNDNEGQPTSSTSPTSWSMYWCNAAHCILVVVDFLCFFCSCSTNFKNIYCLYCIDSPALWTKCPSTRFLVPGERHEAQLTCARSTAHSAVVMSTIPSLRVASLASRLSTGLGNIWSAKAEMRQGGGGWKEFIKSRFQNFCIRFKTTRGQWAGLGFPHLSMCVCVFHAARGPQMFDSQLLKLSLVVLFQPTHKCQSFQMNFKNT